MPRVEATESADSPPTPKIVEEYTAKVIGVTDGDTVRVLTAGREAMIVRLRGIDAPEKSQEHGTKATEALRKYVARKEATVRVTGKDRYGRTLGFLVVEGKEINQRMIEDGWAWHFVAYNNKVRLTNAETQARKEKKGLWAHERPIPPWEFRALKKPVKEASSEVPSSRSSDSNTPMPQFWLNTSTGIRHNSGCKHYKNTSVGRLCGPGDGKGCGICGG